MFKFFYEIHIVGGPNFMIPLAFLLFADLGLIGFVLLRTIQKKGYNSTILELIRQIGALAFVWGLLSTMIGLYFAFDDLSKMTETLPLNVIMGGLKVGLITALYGSIILTVSLVAYIGLRIRGNNSSS